LFGGVAEQGARLIGRGVHAVLLRIAQDRAAPRVRVLHVIDRILVALALGELDVEIDAGGGRPRAEKPAGGVRTDLCEQLVKRYELAGSLAHANVDAVPYESHPGHEQPMDGIGVEAQCLRGGPIARHGSVVVLAPQVDELIEAAGELLGQVPDVRSEVGWLAVGPIDDSVLVVPESRRPEPRRPVLLVDMAGLSQLVHGAFDPPVAVERALAGPHVETHAEALEALLDRGTDALAGPTAEDLARLGPVAGGGNPDIVREAVRQLNDVLAVVPVLRDRIASAPGED